MQLFLDLLPVVAFFIAYKMAGIYVATAVLIVGVLAQTVVSWIRHRKVSPMLLTSAVLVLVLASVALVAGWRGADSVLRVIPDYSPQAPITAVCLALLAGCVLLSLWQTRTCTRTRHDGRRRRHVPDHARTEDPVRRIA